MWYKNRQQIQKHSIYTHIFFFIFWQQLVDGISKQGCVALGILTDALHQLRVLLGDIVQLHKERHLLPVSQRHLHIRDNYKCS